MAYLHWGLIWAHPSNLSTLEKPEDSQLLFAVMTRLQSHLSFSFLPECTFTH